MAKKSLSLFHSKDNVLFDVVNHSTGAALYSGLARAHADKEARARFCIMLGMHKPGGPSGPSSLPLIAQVAAQVQERGRQ